MTKIESGRSMVEMLGVLAIIGVLSIGGIAGYTMAMNHYKANQILDIGSKLSVVAQTTQATNPQNLDDALIKAYDELDIWGPNKYETTFWVEPDGDVFIWIDDKPGIANAIESIAGDRHHIIKIKK